MTESPALPLYHVADPPNSMKTKVRAGLSHGMLRESRRAKSTKPRRGRRPAPCRERERAVTRTPLADARGTGAIPRRVNPPGIAGLPRLGPSRHNRTRAVSVSEWTLG